MLIDLQIRVCGRILWHAVVYSKHSNFPGRQFLFVTISLRAIPGECDFYIHKSNSTYLTDCDVARAEYLATIFYQRPSECRKQGDILCHPVLAGLEVFFRRPIKPFEKYELRTRMLTWDERWLWVITYFVRRQKPGSSPHVFAWCIARMVVKTADGKTVSPSEGLKALGLLQESSATSDHNHQHGLSDKRQFGAHSRCESWTPSDIEGMRLLGKQILTREVKADDYVGLG